MGKIKSIEEKYLTDLKKMPPEKRLEIGMQLSELTLEIAKSAIKDQNPNISPEDMKKKLQRRINLKG